MRTSLWIALAVLTGLTSAARAGETLSAEALLPVHEEQDAYTPGAGFCKDVFLVAWQSGRLAPGDIREGLKFAGDIVACRVDKSGKALDAKPIMICAAADLQERPRVASDGKNFLVVWQDLRNGKDWDVYAARVTPEGKVLDTDGFLVGGGPHNQALPRVVWDGKCFMIAWNDFRSDKYYEVWGARVSADGQVLDPQGIKIANGGWYHCLQPALASGGQGRSLVLWVTACEPVNGYKTPPALARFVTDGKPAQEDVFKNEGTGKSRGHGPSNYAQPMALCAGAKGYLASWTTHRPVSRGGAPNWSDAAVFGAEGTLDKRLSMAGSGPKRWDGQPGPPFEIRNPEVSWDGTAYVAAWHELEATKDAGKCDAVFAARVSEVGEPGEKFRVSGNFASPASMAAVASDGAGTTLIAYEKHPATGDVPIKIGFRMMK